MNEDQGVSQVETTTEASPAENQTTETDQESSAQDNSQTPSQTIPYERFKEVIESRKELESKISQLEDRLGKLAPSTQDNPNPQEEMVKQQLDKYLKDLGYVSRQELEQKEADRKVESTIKELGKKYDGKDGRPKFDRMKVLEFASNKLIGDLEVAYKQMHEAELLDWHIKNALGKTKGTKSEVSDGSGVSQMGTTQADLYEAAKRGDQSALRALIKRTL